MVLIIFHHLNGEQFNLKEFQDYSCFYPQFQLREKNNNNKKKYNVFHIEFDLSLVKKNH